MLTRLLSNYNCSRVIGFIISTSNQNTLDVFRATII